MAYRRRQGITRTSTFKEEIHHPQPLDHHDDDDKDRSSLSPSSTSPSLAAQAIRASAAHRESSHSSAYDGGDSAFFQDYDQRHRSESSDPYEDTSMNRDSKYGFWGVLARKAKSILEENNESKQVETPGRSRPQMLEASSADQLHQPYQQTESFKKLENPRFRKGLDALTSSLNQIGGSFEKAFEEGRTIVENKTADIIQETRKLQMRRKGNSSEAQNQDADLHSSWQPLQPMQETQLKASRDVAMATAAKAKLLLRELKTVRADLTFSKERSSQLEEENKNLRLSRVKGNNAADDDLIRLQLETLLAEKARLAHENSVYARENRFLREIVEYHQLTMQDVVYLDEGTEEVTEVYPGISRVLSASPPSPMSPPSPAEIPSSINPILSVEILAPLDTIQENEDISECEEVSSPVSNSAVPVGEDSGRRSSS